jgi:5'-nucleotidase
MTEKIYPPLKRICNTSKTLPLIVNTSPILRKIKVKTTSQGEDMSDDDNVGLFDLDGSLADYDVSMLREMRSLQHPDEPPIEDLHDESQAYLVNRMRLIKRQPDWWLDLPLIPKGLAVYKAAQSIGFNVQIFTKGPKSLPMAWKEKLEWCQNHLGPDVDVHVVPVKGLTYGKFLYDDFPDYMLAWLKHRPRGLGIMPATKQNADFNHPQVIKHYEHNLADVISALRIVKDRQSREPLNLSREILSLS